MSEAALFSGRGNVLIAVTRRIAMLLTVLWLMSGLFGANRAMAAGATGMTGINRMVEPSFEQVRAQWQSSQARLLDRHGTVVHQLRIDTKVRRLDWVALEDMSAALLSAVLLSEDRRFYEHNGVDWRGVANASLRNLLNQKTHGASTLSMQLAGLLEPQLARGRNGRSWSQKFDQARAAQRLEAHWRKDQIFEAYLNLAPFRGELVGIDAAAHALFGKQPIGLNRWEAALLAVMLRAPNASADRSARRACGILEMNDCTALEGLARLAFARLDSAKPVQVSTLSHASNSSLQGSTNGSISRAAQLAPHLARTLLRSANESVRSSLDMRIQQAAIAALQRHLAALAGRQVDDGAVLVLDNQSGEVLAWVGSSGVRSAAAHVDGVTAMRQAGSTLKPFVYGLAIEDGWLTAASLLEDAPLDLATASGLYIPRNYDNQFKGLVPVRAALASSLNIPAVRAMQFSGSDRLLDRLRRAGFDSLKQPSDFYGHSLALGGADVSLLELTNAYRALANRGQFSPVRFRTGSTTAGSATSTVFNETTAFIINDILSDRNARALTFGLDNVLATRSWSAVKTGTSKDMRDNWCIGFSDRYTVGVWVGNFDGQPMWDVSGVAGAAPIWADLMALLHRESASRAPPPPAGVIRQSIEFDPGVAAAPRREEWFIAGTEQQLFRVAPSGGQRLALLTPLENTRFALDPDIPPASQTILFSAQGERASDADWRLNGRDLGRGARLSWSPQPGLQTLELWLNGRLIEARKFEVRGAQSRLKKVSFRPALSYSETGFRDDPKRHLGGMYGFG